MLLDRMGELKIIKASAGSGKTHTLTGEYLRLLFAKERAYRNILAVTFTNKATEEMKQRVLEELFKGSATDKRARKSLIEILHDYSSFSISTIDRFFQQTLRAFAREIGRNSSYGVELDHNMVLGEAIDNMIHNLDKIENRELLEWLTIFSFDTIERGDGWNIRKKINVLAKELFKESYLVKSRRSGALHNDKISLSAYKELLKNIIDKYESRFRSIGERAVEIIESHSLILEDFKYGKTGGVKMFFDAAKGDVRYPSARFFTLPDQPDNWISASNAKSKPHIFSAIESAYSCGLNSLAIEMEVLSQEFRQYNSAGIIMKNIYTLGILLDIERSVKEYTEENNVVLIPETNELLNRIIDGSDTPFIYEKIGTKIDHFLLDEFQDTSTMQWQNFKPLIENSLSSGNDNLLVGDVKQSIYRWRGSDWSLLNGDIYDQLQGYRIEDRSLSQNWRSSANIVEFNNLFFKYAAEFCDNLLKKGEEGSSALSGTELSAVKVYADSEQTLPENRRSSAGHVMVKFVEAEESRYWKEAALAEFPQIISNLLESGNGYRDITFLVRTNREGISVVTALAENGYPVISDEAMLISSSTSVRNIVTILKYLDNPKNAINNTIIDIERLEVQDTGELVRLPLYELCERIVALLQEREGAGAERESLYMQAFLDQVLEYLRNGRANIASFIDWWEECGAERSIPAPDGQDAIRVMTIHKAKGLGLNAVVVPFFEMGLDHSVSAPIVWTEPEEEPFDLMPLLPVKYGKDLMNSIFEKDYYQERRRTFIDNLNIAYVAFTRAKRELVVLSALPAEKSTRANLSMVLHEMLSASSDMKENTVHIGSWVRVPDESRISKEEREPPAYISYDISNRLKLRLKGEDFFDPESRRNYGIVMHSILSRVYVESDLPDAIAGAVSDGEIGKEESATIKDRLLVAMGSVRERGWFDGSMQIFNELEIIEPGGNISRPDRVLVSGAEAIVIDFKFGVREEHKHLKQVGRYMKLIEEIGYPNTKGYVWYPEIDLVVSAVN